MLNLNFNTVCCNLPYDIHIMYSCVHPSNEIPLRPAFIRKLVIRIINLFLLVRMLDVIYSKKDYIIYCATIYLLNFIGDNNVLGFAFCLLIICNSLKI